MSEQGDVDRAGLAGNAGQAEDARNLEEAGHADEAGRAEFGSLTRWAAELVEDTDVWLVDDLALSRAPARGQLPSAEAIVVAVPGGPEAIGERTWLEMLTARHVRWYVADEVALPERVAAIVAAWEPAAGPQSFSPGEVGLPLRARLRSRREVEVLDATAMPRSRRSLLRVAAGGESAAARSDTELLEEAWRARRAEGDVPSPALDLQSRGCVACGTCVKACPTQVLSLSPTRAHAPAREAGTGRRDSEGLELRYVARGCIGCDTCVSLCPVGALTSDRTLAWNEVFECDERGGEAWVLEELTLTKCARCGTPFAGGAEFCPACEARMKNPFGSSLPPASWLNRD